MKIFGLLRRAVAFVFVCAIALTGFQHEITQIIESAKRVFKNFSGDSFVASFEALRRRLIDSRWKIEAAFYGSAAICVLGVVYSIDKNSGLTVGFLMGVTGIGAAFMFLSAMLLFIIPNPWYRK